MARWTLTVRDGPRVERTRYADLPAALLALESRLEQLRPQARREPLEVLRRRYAAVGQVAVRAEVSGRRRGPGRVRGGVDLRGDGSAEAYTGRWRRSLVLQQVGESAPAALRRALGAAEQR